MSNRVISSTQTIMARAGQLMLVASMAVGLAACQSTADRPMGSERAGQYSMDDGALTNAVKAKLAAEGTASLQRVNVTTNNGTVQLSGIVETAEQKEQASRLAGQVDGVRRVDNALQVRRSEAAGQPDRVLQ